MTNTEQGQQKAEGVQAREGIRAREGVQAKWSVRTQIVFVSLAVLLPMLSALAVLAYRVEHLRVSASAVTETYAAINAGHRLIKAFSDMQQAVHAYALTGNEMFMDAYGRARIALSSAETDAAGSIRENVASERRLLAAVQEVDDFFTQWEERLSTLKPGQNDEASRTQITLDDTAMNRISVSIKGFVNEHEAAIVQRMAEDERARNFVYLGALATSIGTVGLVALFAALLGRSIASPIRQVAHAAQRLGSGHWNERVEPQGGLETRILANAFNQMADKLQQAEASLATRNRELEQSRDRLAVAHEDQLERQRESDDFLYVLSHDLRAPLINIQGFSKRLHGSMTSLNTIFANSEVPAEVTKQLGRVEESLKFINAGTAKIDQLIARLLEIARLTTRPGEHRWIDMEKLAHDVAAACRFQAEERGITIDVEALPSVVGDPAQINQALTNLVDNAIKYMGERPVKKIVISHTIQGDRHCFAVQDTGPGMQPRDQEKIFRMFTRLNPNASPGEGIGLAAVRAIISRHGGRIWVESTLNVGSTFYFTIPRSPDSIPAAQSEPETKVA